MKDFSPSLRTLGAGFWCNRHLILVLVRREVVGRYKGSILGILWSFFHPVFMLVIYTFVFSVVFKARWGAGEGSKAEFALVMFAGILIFNLFAECISRAPSLIVQNPTYVKKVVFPLEILPWVSFGSALFHAGISLVVWFVFYGIVLGVPPFTAFLFPLLLIPLSLLILGISWILASLGVYLRDVSQIISVIVSALMFLTPIFYPLSAIPVKYQVILAINPLTFIVDQARGVLIFGNGLTWSSFCLLTGISLIVAWLGFAWFQKTRKGFADVL